MGGNSYQYFKKEVANYLKEEFKDYSKPTALDIGPGEGIYFKLLSDKFIMDAIEAYYNNILEHKLENKYRYVINEDALFVNIEHYELIILGDVLEHFTVRQAKSLLERIQDKCDEMLIAIPYKFPQKAIYNNPYEEHKQEDLTHEIFMERYPGFVRIFGNNKYGYYIKNKSK